MEYLDEEQALHDTGDDNWPDEKRSHIGVMEDVQGANEKSIG